MENLEVYKKEIKFRINMLVVLCVIALLAVVVGNFYLIDRFPIKQDVTNMVIGFFTGLELVSLFYMGILIRAYRNKDVLKEMYVKETDERTILINMKSGANIVPLLSMGIVVASLIVAYVSYEAFVALMIAAFVQMVVSKLLKMYWSRKI